MLPKLGRKTLRHEVYEQLVQAILNGKLTIGSQLDEHEIANWLGVSRTPLREAINRLVQEGLVTEVPYKGNFVRKFSAKDVQDIYEVRKSLEVMAIRLAIRRMSEDQAHQLAELVDAIASAQQRNDIRQYSELDGQFHALIAKISDNDVLVQTLNSMSLQIELIRLMANRQDATIERAQFERMQMIEAISNRDEELAASFMEAHINNVMKDAIAILADDQA